MGVPFSCPLADLDDLGRQFETLLVRSMSFDSSDVTTALRSVSFNGRDSEPIIMSSFGSRKMVIQGSLSFKGRELGTTISYRAPSDMKENAFVRSSSAVGREKGEKLQTGEKDEKLPTAEKDEKLPTGENGEKLPTDSVSERDPENMSLDSSLPRYQAALRLQKVYKSFRTRRQLADCAVLMEQRWWRLLDFAELKHSSVSFFDIKRPETAVSRWSRARTRAAKVGKGLSKDERARKLALQHWLEAIDPRHRYGHNLQCYYNKWLHCESKQPFFYWLDIGEGKEVSLDRCPRSKLQQQCIKYLGPIERKAYEVAVEDGKFFHKQTGELLDTRGGPQDAKWIFVLSTSRTLYVGQKQKGTFQHSSFLAGGATLSAGRIVVEDGVLKAVWPHSGHYRPTEENFEEFMLFLEERNVDLSIVQRSPADDEEPNVQGSEEKPNSRIRRVPFLRFPRKLHSKITAHQMPKFSRFPQKLHSKITTLQIPKKDDVIKMFKEDEPGEGPPGIQRHVETPPGYETAEEYLSSSSSSSEEGSDYEEPPEGNFLTRINSHKGIKSYQLAQMLSCKWTTGAGPRIGCVRDYPLEVQNRALEEVNLSPRSGSSSSPRRFFLPSPRFYNPTRMSMDSTAGRCPLARSSKYSNTSK